MCQQYLWYCMETVTQSDNSIWNYIERIEQEAELLVLSEL